MTTIAPMRPNGMGRTIGLGVLCMSLALVSVGCAPVNEGPTASSFPSPASSMDDDSGMSDDDQELIPGDQYRDPTVPQMGPGQGLPDVPGYEDVDCDNAEQLCESGEWACDDIADYCDIGTDPGELPDEFEWDK